MEHITVYTTLPDRDSARKLAKALVTERLTACANFFPVESIYRWEGKIEEEREYALILKTRKELYISPKIQKNLTFDKFCVIIFLYANMRILYEKPQRPQREN